ncbi:MAG: AMIN domain-containing protein [Proteobacteria bacterium]|nr:AMIN domain-containing protein [Pseudomonadota bacterium]MBT4106127.1 AMIN domain-containing protein [Pseudomonadota bacterium]MBT4356920.1 AMIN domain-containing protein [Pseudomonadota bacterium]MBT4987373.1 AMIN domain-containing protein [Pseudomonadota bacterium]MBT5190332.1 AMIN domain-containing protein [Pseudomonadota bacterium]
MSKVKSVIFVALLAVAQGVLGTTEVDGMRLWAGPDQIRFVIDLTQQPQYEIFVLKNPDRLVIDLFDAEISGHGVKPPTATETVLKIRTGRPDRYTLRVVLDLDRPVAYSDFLLEPKNPYPYRLVVDISRDQTENAKETRPEKARFKKFLVAVDPGHGGDDPGAIGSGGTQEKRIVLEIAQKLVRLINSDGRMQAFLTRHGDYYVSLRSRIEIARREKADAFISIHADAAKRKTAKGASVFVLSDRGASSEMGKWLAARENASDLAGGVAIGDQEPDIQETLLDMGLDWKLKQSKKLGREILSEIEQIGALHSDQVEEAAFVVLKSVDIPSVLVETGFITNKEEESLLRSTKSQEQISRAIFRGLKRYCDVEVSCLKENVSDALEIFGPSNLVAKSLSGNHSLMLTDRFFDPMDRGDVLDTQSLKRSVVE